MAAIARSVHRLSLIAHASTPSAAVSHLEVQLAAEPAGELALEYHLRGDLARILLPSPRAPARAEELWRHTCFEAFIRRRGAEAYHELNFSPSGEWASYWFRSYRERMAAPPDEPAPTISVHAGPGDLIVKGVVKLRELAGGPEGPWEHCQLALAAVIEDRDRQLSYWAMRHAPGKPDFHHPYGFALEV